MASRCAKCRSPVEAATAVYSEQGELICDACAASAEVSRIQSAGANGLYELEKGLALLPIIVMVLAVLVAAKLGFDRPARIAIALAAGAVGAVLLPWLVSVSTIKRAFNPEEPSLLPDSPGEVETKSILRYVALFAEKHFWSRRRKP